MPFYYDQGGTDRYTLQDFEPSFSAKLGAAINESWAESYGPVLADWAQKKVAGGPKLSAEDAQSVIDGAGFKLNIKPTDNEYSESELNVIIDRQRELTIAKDVRDRTPWDFGSPVRGLAMFGAGIVDPINLATAFVPWTKMVTGVRALEAARLSSSAVTRFGGRAGLGAIEGGISTAVLEPFYAGMRRSLGDDYDAVDSMANIAFGTAFGGGVVGLGGVGVDAFRKATGRAAPSDRFRGMNVDEIQQVQALEADVRAARSQFETVEQFNESEVGAALQKRIDEAPQSVRRALGFQDVEAPVVGADGRKQSPMSSRIVDLDANTIAAQSDAAFISARVDGNVMSIIGSRTEEPMRGRGFGTALYERLINEGLDRGMKVQSESLVDAATARKYAALEKLGFVVERNENATEFAPTGDTLPEGGISTPDGSPVFTVTRGDGYVKPVDRAIDVAERIDPETREAAFRAGTAQLVDGRVLSLDTIINSDPNSGAFANANDIEAAAKLNQAPESIRVADFDASAKVEQENATSQKWDSLSDAEQALAEADVQLNNTIKAGDDAFKYSRAKSEEAKELFVQHNLTASNLLFADRMGGIAVPSLAITKAGAPLTKFGEITLLGSRNLADPAGYAGTKVFGADIYSPRYPEITFLADKQSVAKINEILAPFRNEGDKLLYSEQVNLDSLTSNAVFKRMLAEKLNKDVDLLNWSELKDEAQNLIRESGAQEKIFQGYTYSGTRRYKSHTLENVVNILKKELRGGENYNYGVGSIRAKFTPQFKTIAQIKKAKDRLVNEETFATLKKEVDDEFFKLADSLREFHSASDRYGFTDTVSSTLSDAATMGLPKALKENGFADVPVETMQKAVSFINKLRDLPTEYFEAKITRAVNISEFAAAIVPDDVPKEVLSVLEKNGVTEIRTYKSGDDLSRITAIDSFNELMFSRTGIKPTSLLNAETLTDLISNTFGKNTQKLLDAGQIVIVDKTTDIPFGPHPKDVKAATAPDGKVYMVAENISASEVKGVVLHEIGVHVGMERMLGAETFNKVLSQLDSAIMRGEGWAQAARDNVPDGTLPQHIREEQLAYLVQNSPDLPLVQQIIAAVRAWVYKNFDIARDFITLTEADFRALAVSSLQYAARQDQARVSPSVAYARGDVPDPAVAKTEIEAADANIKRVRSYANVLRAAADKLDDDASAVAAMKSQLPDITAQEIDDLLIGLRTQVKNLRSMTRAAREAVMSGDKADMMQTDAMQAADLLANNLEKAAVIERRNAALNVAARLKASSFVNQFRAKGLDFEGFAALLVGSQRVRTGARMSIDAEYKGYRSELVGGMLADVEKAGLLREFISGSFDRDIYDALWRMGQDKPDMTGINPQAMKLAEILNKYQTNARNNRNRFGAWIRDLQGYITRQSHDMYKIRAVSEDEWANFLKDRLDLPKMMRLGLISETDPMGSLRGLYDDFASGLHMKNIPAEEDTIAMGRGSNLAKRESVSRTLYFKDGLSAFEYNQLYGVGTLAQSVVVGLDRAASSTALLKVLGTNPEVTLTRIMDEYENSLTGDRRAKFRQSRGAILNLLGQVDGSVNIPGNVNAAKVGAFLRAWQSMARLGGALISSVSDLAGYAAELRYSEGKNLFAGVMDGVVALTKGRATGEQADILASLGVFHESIAGSVSARFDNPDLVGGKMAAAMQQFFRLNGLTWWTETLRDAAALQHSSYMALQSTKKFADLDPELNRLLGLYNIGEAKWDLMRMAVTQIEDGRKYLNPEALKTIPRSALEQYISSIGRTVSDTSVNNLLDDLAQTMRVMFVDRAHHAVLEPNARVRGFMLRGTKPGTVPGEIMRYMGQFKSFSIAMVQMVLGREVYGRGYDTVGEYLRKGRGDMVGLAAMITMYGALGYIAMSVKDLIKGREPRDPTDPKTVIAAFAQGGGLGLYGDFLFGEYSRMGRTFTASLAGPVIGNLDTLTDLWTRLRNGDDIAAQSFKTLIDNTPFANLYWLRPLLDYSILFNIQESLNPGFLRRMEQRVERENNQTFIFKPSEVVR